MECLHGKFWMKIPNDRATPTFYCSLKKLSTRYKIACVAGSSFKTEMT